MSRGEKDKRVKRIREEEKIVIEKKEMNKRNEKRN